MVLECRRCGISIRKLERIEDAIARGFVRQHGPHGQLLGTVSTMQARAIPGGFVAGGTTVTAPLPPPRGAARASTFGEAVYEAYRELLAEGGP